MSNRPRRVSAWSAGKICLYARSPVAPKKTNASEYSANAVYPFFFYDFLSSVPGVYCNRAAAQTDFAADLVVAEAVFT